MGTRTLRACSAVVAGSIAITAALGTATPVWAAPNPAKAVGIVPNPWGCGAKVASPHPTEGVIKVHGTIECSAEAPSATSSVGLWVSRWYGWDQVDHRTRTSQFARYVDASPRWNPGMGCHHYRGVGTFTVAGGGRSYDAPVLTNYDQRYLRGQSPGCGVNWRS